MQRGPDRVRKSRRLLLAVALCLVALPAVANAVEVELEIDQTRLSTDEQLIVRVTATGQYSELVAPTSEGFDFRQSGRSTQVSIVGRQMRRSEQFSWTGTPRRPGRYKVGPVLARHNGKVVGRSRVVEVEVLDGRAALGPARSPEAATDPRNFAGEAFFVRPILGVNSPFAGQPFVAEFMLYWSQSAGVQNIAKSGDASYEGFEVEDLHAGKPPERDKVRFAGRHYENQSVSKVLLTAPVAGKYEIVGPRFRMEAGDFFSTRAYRIGAPPVAIQVRPVPTEGRPESYQKGAIGDLRLSAHLVERGQPTQTMTVKPGERLVLNVQVSGRGNLLGLAEMRPAAVPGMAIEALPGRADERVRLGANGAEGSRNWQYMLSFDQPGRHTIPAMVWSCFNPNEETFHTDTAGPFVIHVVGPAPATDPAVAQAPRPEVTRSPGAAPVPAVAPTGKLELRPIAAHADLAQTAMAPWTDSPWFWRLAGLPWLGALLMLLWSLGRRLHARNAPQRRLAGAMAEASQKLRAASEQPTQVGYAAMRDAADGYLQTRWGLRLSGLTYRTLVQALTKAGADEADANALVDQLEHCDFARFAPSGDREGDLERTAVEIAAVLARLDGALDRPGGGLGRAQAGALLLGLAGMVALLSPGSAAASTLDADFTAANKRFVQGDLEGAVTSWQGLLQHGLRSAAVHYNLGNAQARLGRLGRAVGHYKKAQRLAPAPALAADIQHNLAGVRAQLAEQARRRHRVLHVFDESPELEVAVGRAAPRTLLGFLVIGGGIAAMLLFGMMLLRTDLARDWRLKAALAVALLGHVTGAAWLLQAERVEESVRHGVVVQEDAPLSPCVGVGETIHLPEGLEVRVLRQRPDGRRQVRLPNGRAGCVPGAAVEEV